MIIEGMKTITSISPGEKMPDSSHKTPPKTCFAIYMKNPDFLRPPISMVHLFGVIKMGGIKTICLQFGNKKNMILIRSKIYIKN
jgi:hypothetical protein